MLIAASLPASAALKGHEAPAERLAARQEDPTAHQKILSEMWQRRILDSETTRWSPKDMALLQRIRWAEEWGALRVLEGKSRNLKGLVVARSAGVSQKSVARLTREGFDRYLRIKTKRALAYFEKKGVDAKWVFSLKDIKGRPLFDKGGRLSEWGDVLYTRVSIGKPAFWETPWGEVMGNRPPKEMERPAPSKPGKDKGSKGKP